MRYGQFCKYRITWYKPYQFVLLVIAHLWIVSFNGKIVINRLLRRLVQS